MQDLLDYLKKLDDNAYENANSTWNKTRKFPKIFRHFVYKRLRIKDYQLYKKFTFEGLTYEVTDIYKDFKVAYHCLNYDGRLAPSGRQMKRNGLFGIGSIKDLTLVFLESV